MNPDRPSVLIVDDDDDVLLMLRASLEAEGFRTSLAASGESALRQLDESLPDAVVLDLMMPAVDGWAVMEDLSRRGRRPGLVVLSARTRPGDMTRAYESGADGYFTKPFRFDSLAAEIRRVIRRSERRRARHRRRMIRALRSGLAPLS